MKLQSIYYPTLRSVRTASEVLKGISQETPLMPSYRYSKFYESNVLFKREDLQQVRSYKIRGAYHKIKSLKKPEQKQGIVCASAGNHAQGVAFACAKLQIQGFIYMPMPTPKQKVEQVKMFGGQYIKIILIGDTFDDAYEAAKTESDRSQKPFIHPFNDEKIIEGQATVGLEILEQSKVHIDYVFVPIGGGGLASGLSAVFNILSPKTKIIGVEPFGAPAMKTSIDNKVNTTLPEIDKFVDGAAVKRVGDLNFDICKNLLSDIVLIKEGKICQVILDVYNKDALVLEPAGALTIAALEHYKHNIKDKNVVCVISGSNNDITRMAEIKERALLFNKLKHYFIVRFPQRSGALKQFVAEILGPKDDIAHFQYIKKNSRESGPAVVGIEIEKQEDLQPLIERMKANHFYGEYLNDKPNLFEFLT